jgi:hypothetical protein
MRLILPLRNLDPVRSRCYLIHVSIFTVAALSFLLAACGGGASPKAVANLATTSTTAAPGAVTGSSSPGDPLAEYASCMRSHGVLNFPDQAAFGTSTGIKNAKGQMAQITQSEASTPRFKAAQRACAKYYGPPAPSPHVSPQEMQKLLAVAHCMHAHGVPTYPDPNPTTGHLSAAGIDTNSPQVLAALRACSSLGRAAGLSAPNTGP